MSSKLSTLVSGSPLTGADAAQADGLYVYDASASGSAKSKGITLLEFIKALASYTASANSSDNTTITPGAICVCHVEITTVTGSGSTTRAMVLATSGSPVAGARILHRLALPTTAEITIEWRNATSGGTLITSMLTDGSGDDAVAEFYFDGTAWQFLRFVSPANA